MASSKSPRLIFVSRDHVYWQPIGETARYVQVIRWRIINGKLMVLVKEVDRALAGIALVPEEELDEIS